MGLGDAPPPFIYFSLTENTVEVCVCLELNHKLNSVADTSNVCTVEIGKLGSKVCSMTKLQGSLKKIHYF